jgi:type IV secretion system protein TrbE
VFFDKDRSSYAACTHSGGTFIEIDRRESTLKLNPFAQLHSGPEEQKFVTDLVMNFLTISGYPLESSSAGRIHSGVQAVAEARSELRGWSLFVTALQDPSMREALRPFLSGGHYSRLFTDGPDALSDSRFITFEMGSLMRTPGDPIVALVFHYLFHRIESRFSPDEPTLVMVDEAWKFLDSPVVAQILRELLKTARKKGAAVVLSTQEVADARGSDVFSTIATNCPTKILLPNSLALQAGSAAMYREIGLSETDLRILSEATPKRDYLFVTPSGNQLFRLDLSEAELALLTSETLPAHLDAELGADRVTTTTEVGV